MSEPQDIRRRRAGQNRLRFHEPSTQADATSNWSEGIRALYDGVVQEPLPADFVKLLDELKKKNAN